MVYVQFFEDAEAIYINWGSLNKKAGKNLFKKMKQFMENGPGELYTSWYFDNISLYPQSGKYDVRIVIEELKLIVKFMNDNNIPWEGRKIVFTEKSGKEYYPGFIVIKEDIVVLSYIIDTDQFETEYIPIVESKKLI